MSRKRNYDRNPVTDAKAIVASPGLETIAEPLTAVMDPDDAMGFVILNCLISPFRSLAVADSIIRDDDLWAILTVQAGRVGRHLPPTPPTARKYTELLNRITPEVREQFMAATTEVAHQISVTAGLLTPDAVLDPRVPRRENTVTIDGMVNQLKDRTRKGLPGKPIDDDPEERQSDHNRKVEYGDPFVIASVSGPKPQQRVVLGARPFGDGNEIGASLRLVDEIADRADGGVHAVVCDGLLTGCHFSRLLKRGIIAVARMTAAAATAEYAVKMPETQIRTLRGTRRRPKGKVLRKRHMQARRLGIISHDSPSGPCEHRIWAVDGSLVVLDIERYPVFADPRLAPEDVEFAPFTGAPRLLATYEYRCGGATYQHRHIIDTDTVPDLRPVPETSGPYRLMQQWLAGIESDVNRVKNAANTYGRSGCVELDDEAIRMQGRMHHFNSVAWDLHVAQFTKNAQRQVKL